MTSPVMIRMPQRRHAATAAMPRPITMPPITGGQERRTRRTSARIRRARPRRARRSPRGRGSSGVSGRARRDTRERAPSCEDLLQGERHLLERADRDHVGVTDAPQGTGRRRRVGDDGESPRTERQSRAGQAQVVGSHARIRRRARRRSRAASSPTRARRARRCHPRAACCSRSRRASRAAACRCRRAARAPARACPRAASRGAREGRSSPPPRWRARSPRRSA